MARFGQDRNEYMFIVQKPEGKSPLGTPRCRWEDYNTIGWRGVSWVNLTLIGTIGRIM